MSEIKVRQGETISNALRRLKRAVDTEETLKIVRERRFYQKPSRKRYLQRKKAKFDQKIRSKYDY